MVRGQARRRERFLPYQYERFGLTLEPIRCTLDGGREFEAFKDERHLIDLSDFRFTTVELEVQVAVSQQLLDNVLPPSERQNPPVKLVLAVRCGQTRLRRGVTFVGPIEGGSEYRQRVVLRRPDVIGAVELVPFLVRTTAIDDTSGFASQPGARLASARPWEVRLDFLRNPTGAYLDIRYVSFREQGSVAFPWPESLFQLEADRENPILWLNLDHSQVCEVLNNNANVGHRAQVRDVFYDYLSHTVWSRLFHKATSDLLASEEVPFEWEDSVLRQFLPSLYPEEANHESRIAAIKRDLEGDDQTALEGRLDAVLQSRLEVPKHMKRLAEANE